jgi:regulator of sigma E protease
MDVMGSTANLLLVIAGFGMLVAVHEFGHFIAAKWAGVRVDAFAIGMGPTLLSYRKGIGLRVGSTDGAVVARAGAAAITLGRDKLAALGLSETEYSLRALPLGGFVRMLGQDDLDPNATIGDPRSYSSAPIWKRMIIVSAGVTCNVLLAIALFVVAFMIGVRFDAPIVGSVVPGEPAALAGIEPGDEVVAIDGEPVSTFADIQIASAMSRPGVPLAVTVRRADAGGVREVRVQVEPEASASAGMRTMGVTPAASTTLVTEEDARPFLRSALMRAGFWDHSPDGMSAAARWGITDPALSEAAGTPPTLQQFEENFRGASLLSIDGAPIASYEGLIRAAAQADGRPIATQWALTGLGEVAVAMRCVPSWQILEYTEKPAQATVDYEFGLLGLSPLTRIGRVPASSTAAGVLEEGDVVLRVGDVIGPRLMEFRLALAEHAGKSIRMLVLRGEQHTEREVWVGIDGRLGLEIGNAWDTPIIARPFARTGAAPGTPTPIAALDLAPLTRIESVNGTSVGTWTDIFRAVQSAAIAGGAKLPITVLPPGAVSASQRVDIVLTESTRASVAALKWRPALGSEWFESAEVVLAANGSPVRAIGMGFIETKKLVLMTYLTLDRLFRGTVGVSQLRGPVGIVHIGTRVADRGVTYLVFFMAMISVNLAVINFLPIPIADGGLMVFLIYEKLRGRPPSPAFQSGALVAGLVIVGLLFAVTFYNDVMRLVT